jgi:hypothetical protein
MFGVIWVYDKSGKKIRSFRQSNFGRELGPMWGDKYIFYLGSADDKLIELPSSPGNGDANLRCY